VGNIFLVPCSINGDLTYDVWAFNRDTMGDLTIQQNKDLTIDYP
jgi:hypothetical protein